MTEILFVATALPTVATALLTVATAALTVMLCQQRRRNQRQEAPTVLGWHVRHLAAAVDGTRCVSRSRTVQVDGRLVKLTVEPGEEPGRNHAVYDLHVQEGSD